MSLSTRACCLTKKGMGKLHTNVLQPIKARVWANCPFQDSEEGTLPHYNTYVSFF